MPIKDRPQIDWDDATFKYFRKDEIMTRKALEDIINTNHMRTGFTGVDVYVNDMRFNAPEVTFTQNYGEVPKVYIHGDLSISPMPTIKDVIFNPPATIVFWSDNTKTVVKADEEFYDPEKGLAMAISRKMIGDNKREYYNTFKHYLKKWDKQTKQDKFRKYMEEALDNAFEKYHDEQYNEIHKDVPTVSDWVDDLHY